MCIDASPGIFTIQTTITLNITMAATMRQEFTRAAPKRRTALDPRKKQFSTATFQNVEYEHRLSFYAVPPTADITLEQFEQWAIDRLRGLYIRAQGVKLLY
jgi:hypothetical protein